MHLIPDMPSISIRMYVLCYIYMRKLLDCHAPNTTSTQYLTVHICMSADISTLLELKAGLYPGKFKNVTALAANREYNTSRCFERVWVTFW